MAEENTETTTEPVKTPVEQNKPAEPETQTQVKTFTQEEVNALNAKTRKKERGAFLKELGYNSEEEFKEAQEKKKNDMGLQEKLALTAKEKAELAEKYTKAEAKLAALDLDIDKSKVDRVIKLAGTYDGDDINEKIKAVLADFPEFVKKEGVTPKPAFGAKVGPDTGGKTAKEIGLEIARKSMK